MNGSVGFDRDVREEAVAFIFTDQIGELVVASVDFVATDKTPFGDVYPFIRFVRSLVGKGIAVDDVFGEDVTDGLYTGGLAFRFEQLIVPLHKVIQESLSAGRGVVFLNLDAVDAGDGPDGIVFVLELGVSFGCDTGLADGEFAAKNLDEEVAVTASRLQETGIDPIRLRLHKVEHRVHFARVRENLAVCQHPFLGLDLGVHSALSLGIRVLFGKAVTYDHKKSVNDLHSHFRAVGDRNDE